MRKLLFVALLGTAISMAGQAAFSQDDNDQPNDVGPGPAGSEMRIEQLSDQMRELTGRIEELRHDLDSLRAQMAKMSSDTDMRLRTLEGGGAAGGPNTAMGGPPQQQPPTRIQPPPLNPPPRGRNQPSPENQTAMAPPEPGDAGNLPSGSPQQQYDYAFGLLRDANYPAAERALRDFVRRYPNNRLSSNAQYWLGETFFVRRNFQAAAAAFAEGYQRYPKGPKAADDLLKLGSSLSMLGRRADACRSFAQLDRDFPIAPANLKAKEAEEKRRAGCR